MKSRHCWWIIVLFLPGVVCSSELSFITEPSDVVVLPKEAVLLDCLAHGQPPVTIRWLRDGQMLSESQKVQFLSNGSLFLPEVEPGLDGFYQCLSQNQFGAVLSQRSRLTIASISAFVHQPESVSATEGSVARFSCAVASSPAAALTWEFNQRTLAAPTDRLTVLPNGVLQIQDVQRDDAGLYRCVAANRGGVLRSRDAALAVETGATAPPRQKPRIIAAPQNVSASLQQTVVLECVATGNPAPIVSWSRADGKPIDVYKARVLGNGNLVITDVDPQHSGVYLCRATTPRTRNYTIAAANLTVLVPPSLVEKPESQTRPRAGTARFMCRAVGLPTPRVSWLKNGEQVHLNGRIKMYNSKLVITQIIPEDDAIYQCVAESSEGSVLSVARLIVVMSEDRPGAPRNIHAETISSAAILLAWQRPSYNADKVIAYSVHYTRAEGLNNEEYQVVIGNDTTSYIVDDLEPARNYSFYVVAYMPMGASRMSDQVSRQTLEDVPLRTPELSLISTSSTDIQVRWRPLSIKLSRGRVSSYRLSYRTASDDTLHSLELPQNATHHHLEALQPDTIYLLRMSAATRVGWCEPSAWTSHRTPTVSGSKVPAAPLLLLEPLNCTSFSARWQISSDSVAVQGFRLSFHEENQPEQPSLRLQAQTFSHTISGLDPRRKYHVKILAVGQAGDGYQADQTVSTPGCVSPRDQVSAAPPAPDHVVVLTSNSSQVSLRWSRPAFTSGKMVSYSVRCTPVGTSHASEIRYLQTVKQTVSFVDLHPNTRYEFVVRLHVDHMTSAWSSALFQQTLAAAPRRPPTSVRVTLIEDDTALVSWKEPNEANVVVTHYTIMFVSQSSWTSGQWQVLQREGTHTMALLEKLEAGNVYLVKISASNQVGDGPFSQVVELPLRRSHSRSKNPRHSENLQESLVFSDGLYHIDQKSMTGIIVGVSIALSCIVMCALILISKSRQRKSPGHKVLAAPARNNDLHPENVEALMPMISEHFIEAEGGARFLINSAGPVQNQNQRWLLLQRDVMPEDDAASRASLYEAGKVVLRYEERLGSKPLPPSSREIIYGPSHSEGSSEVSPETSDSGHYSTDEVSDSSRTCAHTAAEPRPAHGLEAEKSVCSTCR